MLPSYCRSCCVRTVVILLLLSIIGVVLWLVLRPTTPRFYLLGFQTPSIATMTSSIPTGTPTFIFYQLEIINKDNELGIFYNDLHVAVYFNGKASNSSVVPAFYQGHRKSALKDGAVDGGSVQAQVSEVVRGLAAPPPPALKMLFWVRVVGSYRYKGLVVPKSNRHEVDVAGLVMVDSDGRKIENRRIELRSSSAATVVHGSACGPVAPLVLFSMWLCIL